MPRSKLKTVNKAVLSRLEKALGSKVACDRCGKPITVGMKVFHSKKLFFGKDRNGNLPRHAVWVRCKNCYEKSFVDNHHKKEKCGCREIAEALKNGKIAINIDFQPYDSLTEYFGESAKTRMSYVGLEIECVVFVCPECKARLTVTFPFSGKTL